MIDLKKRQETQELVVNIPVRFKRNFSPTEVVERSLEYILSQSAEKVKAAITRYIEYKQECLFLNRHKVCSVTDTEVRYIDKNNVLKVYSTKEIMYLETIRDYGCFKEYSKKEYSALLHAMAFWGEMDEEYYTIYHLLIDAIAK